MLTVSDFLSSDVETFLLGSFYNRSLKYEFQGIHYIYCYSDFRQSQKVNPNKFNFDDYVSNDFIRDLNSNSWPGKWVNSTAQLIPGSSLKKKGIFILENDLNLSLNSFFNKLHFKISAMEFLLDDEFNDDKKNFIRGFVENRGSIDTKASYISNDYFFNSSFELKKVRLLSERLNVPTNALNMNFRNLQKQYVTGFNKRNPQFRMNIHWYASNVGFLNKYKSFIYKTKHGNHLVNSKNNFDYYSSSMNPSQDTINVSFNKYLDIYFEHMYNKDLTKVQINNLRNQLNFNESTNTKSLRSKSIIKLFSEISEDRCASCQTTETSLNSKTNRHNFDIHHFISLANDPDVLDNIDNLVKLCAVCHDALTPNRTSQENQLKICERILNHSHIVQEFAKAYYDTEDLDYIVSTVQKSLR